MEITPEQVQELQNKVAELEKFKNDSAPQLEAYEKAKSEWETKEKEYQSQVNPNWQEARKKIDALTELAKSKGIQFDALGNPINPNQSLTADEIEKRAREATKSEMLNARVEEMLSDYDAETARLVKHYFNKLSAGEELTITNVRKFMLQAEKAIEADGVTPAKRLTGVIGSGPRVNSNNSISDERAKELGQAFGFSFADKDNK
mgnify:CR=1 FL=1